VIEQKLSKIMKKIIE